MTNSSDSEESNSQQTLDDIVQVSPSSTPTESKRNDSVATSDDEYVVNTNPFSGGKINSQIAIEVGEKEKDVHPINLEPSTLQMYEQLEECQRYLGFARDKNDFRRTIKERYDDWTESFFKLSKLLEKDGDSFEQEVMTLYEDYLGEINDRTNKETNEKQTNNFIANTINEVASRPAFNAKNGEQGEIEVLAQLSVRGQIGVVEFNGNADLVIMWPLGDNKVHIRVIDVKSSFKEQTYQQMQVSTYTLLVSAIVDHFDMENVGDVTITGGIHYRETNIHGKNPEDFPIFDLGPREQEVKELCKYDGQIHKHSKKKTQNYEWQLNDKCLQCRWSEACGRDSISNVDTSILGITSGEQKTLSDNGINTIYDLAGLATVPFDHSGNPTEQFDFRPRDSWAKSKMDKLSRDASIAPKLKHLIQKSRTIIHNIHQGEHPYASESNYEWLVGSGRGNLPHDERLNDDDVITEGSMIRVYLNIQRDHRRDVVTMVNGAVTSSIHYDEHNNDPITFSHLPTKIGEDVDEAHEQERQLLDESVSSIFDAIKEVSSETGHEDVPVHFYFYTPNEQKILIDGLRRNNDISQLAAFRDLLGLRNGVTEHKYDQSIVSYVQPEVENRMALGVPYYSLMPVWNQLHPNKNGQFEYPNVKFVDFTNADVDGETINLMSVFRRKLFADSDKYKLKSKDNDGIELIEHTEEGDGTIKTIPRGGASIPLEYIWSVCEGGMTEDWYDDGDEEDIPIDSYMYREKGGEKIKQSDLQKLGELFALSLSHVERSISYKNRFEVEKKRLPISQLETFDLGNSTITRACREFIELEHRAGMQDSRKHYGKDIHERIRSGKSTYVGVQKINKEKSGTYRVKGRLMYDYDTLWVDQESDENKWSEIAEACRIKGGDDSEKGDYLIANPIDMTDGNPNHISIDSIDEIESGALVQIVDINLKKDEENNVYPSIEFEVRTNGSFGGGRFTGRYTKGAKVSSQKITTEIERYNRDDNTVLFQPNGYYVLDPGTNNIVAQNHYELLQEIEGTTLEKLLTQLSNGDTTSPTTNKFNQKSVDEFVNTLNDTIDESPNKKQRDFIKETKSQISILQGPPGTGKTSGALAPTLFSRLYSFNQEQKPLRGLVSGPSNTSVTEVMDDLDDLMEKLKEEYPDIVDNTSIVRLVGSDKENPYNHCTYVNMSEKGTEEKAQLFAQLSNNHTIENGAKHLIVFATPYRHKKLFDQIGGDSGASGIANKGTTVFDLLAVDEASMLRLPEFINLGAFVDDNAQILVSGDHRQMPPVLKHNWENETRRTIKEEGAYLSTLNYLRYLNTDETVNMSDEYLDEIQASQTASLPMTRLERTYRCHKCVTGFLRKYLYEKYDGINYNSNVTDTIDTPPSLSNGVDEALKPEGPLTLIIHDDLTNNQSSNTEVDIVDALTKPLEEVLDTDGDNSPIGIVTPHNAQKGLLNNRVKSPLVDTVERFQGGDKNTIIVSATVSDPDSLKLEEDFILNPNRLNVAMSRMEQKLIVIAPKSIFRLTPKDTDDFKRSLLWKFLYKETDAYHENYDWSGTLSEFTNGNTSYGSNENTNVSVYTLDENHFD